MKLKKLKWEYLETENAHESQHNGLGYFVIREDGMGFRDVYHHPYLNFTCMYHPYKGGEIKIFSEVTGGKKNLNDLKDYCQVTLENYAHLVLMTIDDLKD